MIATFTIPMRPPSLNNMYVSSRCGKRRHLSREAVKFKNFAKYHIANEFKYDEKKYALEVEIYFYLKNVFTKDGKISKTSKDYDGMIKCVQDVIFDIIKIDDSQVCKATIFKIDALEDCVVYILKTMPLTLVKR